MAVLVDESTSFTVGDQGVVPKHRWRRTPGPLCARGRIHRSAKWQADESGERRDPESTAGSLTASKVAVTKAPDLDRPSFTGVPIAPPVGP